VPTTRTAPRRFFQRSVSRSCTAICALRDALRYAGFALCRHSRKHDQSHIETNTHANRFLDEAEAASTSRRGKDDTPARTTRIGSPLRLSQSRGLIGMVLTLCSFVLQPDKHADYECPSTHPCLRDCELGSSGEENAFARPSQGKGPAMLNTTDPPQPGWTPFWTSDPRDPSASVKSMCGRPATPRILARWPHLFPGALRSRSYYLSLAWPILVGCLVWVARHQTAAERHCPRRCGSSWRSRNSFGLGLKRTLLAPGVLATAAPGRITSTTQRIMKALNGLRFHHLAAVVYRHGPSSHPLACGRRWDPRGRRHAQRPLALLIFHRRGSSDQPSENRACRFRV